MKNGADGMDGVDKQQGLPDRIVLTGFRATGKTAVGKALARLTGFRFLDTDQELCERMGCSVTEAVRQHGWSYFREQEQTLLAELPCWQETIIATGGGAILHQNEWQELHQGRFCGLAAHGSRHHPVSAGAGPEDCRATACINRRHGQAGGCAGSGQGDIRCAGGTGTALSGRFRLGAGYGGKNAGGVGWGDL